MLKRLEDNMELYIQLRDKLDIIGFGIAHVENDGELEYLSMMFDEEDARHFLNVGLDSDSVENVARKMNRDVDTVSERLQDMSLRGLLFRERVDGEVKYRAIPLLHGVVEFNVNRHTPEQLNAFTKIAAAGMRGRYYRYEPFQRSLPIRPSAVKPGELLPQDDVRSILKNAKTIAVTECVCRNIAHQLGGGCDHTMETCMAINEWAEYYVENEDGRFITYEEAEKILEICDEEALSVHCANSESNEIICCCCDCCCGLIKGYKFFPDNDAVPDTTNYRMVHDNEKCTNCGVCVDRCPMDALKMGDDGIIAYNAQVCNGCGLCVTSCPENATILERKEKYYSPKGKTWFDTYKVIADKRRDLGEITF